jgi:hypothetical protein
VLRHGIEAAESKPVGDFPKGRGGAIRPLPFLDEIEYLLLFARQSNHIVYPYSIMRVFPVNPEDGSRVYYLHSRLLDHLNQRNPGEYPTRAPV